MLSKWLNRHAWLGILGAALLSAGAIQRADAQPIPISLIEVKERTETRAIPAPVKKETKSGLAPGASKVATQGKEGQEIRVYTQVLVDGKIMSEKLKSVRRVEPTPRIVHTGRAGTRGTLTSRSAPRSGRTLRKAANAASSTRKRTSEEELSSVGFRAETRDLAPAQVAFASARGWQLEGGKVMTMKSTAYLPHAGRANPTFRTATGRPARRGMVAVDPRVIPLHSILYVEGYGWAIAADTGGAIRGSIIDVCVDEMTEARQWGRRTVRVIVFPQRYTRDLQR